MANNDGTPTGQQQPFATWGDFNNLSFMVKQAIAKLQTATLVRVMACTNAGEVSPVGNVDILPLINQIDGQGNATPHVTIFNVPYFRVQGGANAVIIDPQVGDIGIAVFASRDITKIKNTKEAGNPGSLRSYNFADALYLGGLLNGVPTQYVRFSSAGITLKSAVSVILDTPLVTVTGQIVAMGDVHGAGISLQTHQHIPTALNVPTGPPIP